MSTATIEGTSFPINGSPLLGSTYTTLTAPVETVNRSFRSERPLKDIIADLSNPDNVRPFVRTRRQGSTDIKYVAWHDATRLLDGYAPGWSYNIDRVEHINNKVMMVVSIEIPCLEGYVVRQASGNEDDVTSSYGDPFSNAESMALRRAAAKFGLGRFLYGGGG